MQLKVCGKGALTRNQIKTAIPYMMKLMNSHRILDNSEILVKFEHLDCHATCYMHEPGEFEISLSNKLNSKKCLFALAMAPIYLLPIMILKKDNPKTEGLSLNFWNKHGLMK